MRVARVYGEPFSLSFSHALIVALAVVGDKLRCIPMFTRIAADVSFEEIGGKLSYMQTLITTNLPDSC